MKISGIKTIIFLFMFVFIAGIGWSQVIIDVRSDSLLATPSDSVFILRRQIQETPLNPSLHLKLAEVFLARERLDEAESEFNLVLKFDSLSVEALTGLGKVHFNRQPSKIIPFERLKELIKQDHKSQAIKKLNRALELKPDYKPARYFLARTFQEKGDEHSLELARDQFTKLVNEQPDYCDVLYQLGYTYQKMGKYQQALQVFNKIKNLMPDFSRANIRMAEVYFELKDYQRATESYFDGIESLEDKTMLNYLFDEQKIIFTPEELNRFEMAPDSVKKKLFKRFWKQRDPDPLTPENERLMEHFRRLKFARENFHFTAPPYYDDRGKIYIKYGPPDERYPDQFSRLPAKDNESWSYESIEKGLVFDFVSEAGYFRLVEDLTEAAISGSSYEARLALAAQLYNDRSHLSQSYNNLAIGLSTDRLNTFRNQKMNAVKKYPGEIYRPDFKTKVFPFVTKWAQFKGDSNKTRVELYTSFPGIVIEFQKVDNRYVNYTDFFVDIMDSNFNSVIVDRQRCLIARDSLEKMESRHFLLQNNYQLVPGLYEFALVINNTDQTLKGIQKKDIYIRDFSSDRLMLSDIQLSSKISGDINPLNPSIVKNDLSIMPYPFSRVMRSRPIHIYFEIYNLTVAEDHKANFQVDYSLRTLEPERNLWQKTIAAIPRMFSSKEKSMISTTVQREADSRKVFEYISFDLRNLNTGLTELRVTVTDRNNQNTSENSIVFTLIK